MDTTIKKPLSLTEVILALNGGAAAGELQEKIRETVRQCQRTQKKGKITLTLAIAPSGANGIQIVDTVKADIPEFDREPTNFYTDEFGGLSRRNPLQPEMPGIPEGN